MAKLDLILAIDQAAAALRAARKALLNASILPAKLARPTVTHEMSEEGRQRIAEAQRKRWAVKKRADRKAARIKGL